MFDLLFFYFFIMRFCKNKKQNGRERNKMFCAFLLHKVVLSMLFCERFVTFKKLVLARKSGYEPIYNPLKKAL